MEINLKSTPWSPRAWHSHRRGSRCVHWESRETAERRAVIHVCTVGGHPVQPQPGLLQHPAPSTTPAIPQHGHPGVLTFPGEGAPEQGQDLHVPPGCVPADWTSSSYLQPRGWMPQGLEGAGLSPCKSCGHAAQEEPGPGAESCSEVAATTHRWTAKREGQPSTPRGACSQQRDALQLLCSFPPGKARAG